MADATNPDPQQEPLREITLDSRLLRALAHPLRVRLLGQLRSDGPSTATRLAGHLGLNSGVTSYHLRQLAEHGLVSELPKQGGGRDRWWQAAHESTRLQPAALREDADKELASTYLAGVASGYTDAIQNAARELPYLPPDWREASTTSDFPLKLTPGELQSLVQELFEVIGRYRRDDHDQEAPPDAVPVAVQLQAFPRPGILNAQGET
ncbi:winged helix-turn-helix domain-containing protein [Kineosporia mesophila]|nr:helix-turn-helix domain-containing protein [Kineosporia mesophila]MCD5352129.1 helix-turn-helix domain-containing protein [Kineosporia mesophila]